MRTILAAIVVFAVVFVATSVVQTKLTEASRLAEICQQLDADWSTGMIHEDHASGWVFGADGEGSCMVLGHADDEGASEELWRSLMGLSPEDYKSVSLEDLGEQEGSYVIEEVTE